MYALSQEFVRAELDYRRERLTESARRSRRSRRALATNPTAPIAPTPHASRLHRVRMTLLHS